MPKSRLRKNRKVKARSNAEKSMNAPPGLSYGLTYGKDMNSHIGGTRTQLAQRQRQKK
jgi:hypothetical protein